MSIEEIFSKLISHMIEGIMFHDEMAKAYDFLGLYGYARCQDYHHLEETCGYRQLYNYYATHYYQLIIVDNIPKPKIISDTWYKYHTQVVDASTKRNAIKEFSNKWVEWEKSTKKLYQEMRQELIALNEIDAALELDKYIRDVSKELHFAEKALLNLESINYDMSLIIDWQNHLYNKYTKKLGW